jgi:predicted DNA-binding mobile mystery protein A
MHRTLSSRHLTLGSVLTSYSLPRTSVKLEFRKLRLTQLDQRLAPARDLLPRPMDGWLASVREALGLTQQQVGTKMRATRQAIREFELGEAQDRITLRALRRVAGVMGCDLVYALVPKSGSFTELAETAVRERVAREVKSVVHSMALEDQKPSNAKQLIEDETRWRLSPKKTR